MNYRAIQAVLAATGIGATVGNWASRASKARAGNKRLNKHAYVVRTQPTERLSKVVDMLRAGDRAYSVSPLLSEPSLWEP